jgi:hypothetical protein
MARELSPSLCPKVANLEARTALTRIRKLADVRRTSCRGTASAAADAPTPDPAPFCSSGICVKRASNQVIRLDRRLPVFEFGFDPCFPPRGLIWLIASAGIVQIQSGESEDCL